MDNQEKLNTKIGNHLAIIFVIFLISIVSYNHSEDPQGWGVLWFIFLILFAVGQVIIDVVNSKYPPKIKKVNTNTWVNKLPSWSIWALIAFGVILIFSLTFIFN